MVGAHTRVFGPLMASGSRKTTDTNRCSVCMFISQHSPVIVTTLRPNGDDRSQWDNRCKSEDVYINAKA